jgi:hypothetical protein
MRKKLKVCWIVALIIVSFLPSLSKSTENENNVAFILNKLEEIQKDGVTEKEINYFVKILQEKFGKDSIYINTICRVIGIGAGILFPPFLPISAVLISFPITLLTTEELQGQWSHGIQLAIFIGFIGLPIYITPLPLFIIVGFAGVVIGIVFD